MNRSLLVLACLLSMGCAGRLNTDLLKARIREQSAQITDSKQEIARTKSDLKTARLEVDRLRSELDQSASKPDNSGDQPSIQISKVHIFQLASGGLNKDSKPGDDAVVVQFAPFDLDNVPIKQPGKVDITLIDPLLDDDEQQIGRWSFPVEECRSRWTRGIASTGYQFTLPLKQSPEHSELVVKIRFEPAKDQRYEASQIVKVALTPERRVAANNKPLNKLRQLVDDTDESLPPAGVDDPNIDDVADTDWDDDEEKAESVKKVHVIRDSTNWTENSIPILR